MNRPTKCQRLFVKKPWPKSATTSCRHAGPKPCPEKKLLGKRRHTRDRLPVAYWLKKRANKRHVGTRYPLVGTTAGTTSAPQRCHINVYPQVRVHTCQKHGDRGQEHKSRVWHSKKLSFSLLSVSRADHDFTAPLTGPLLRCNNAPTWLALNVSFKVLSYFCQIKRHAFYPTKRWRFSSKKRSDMPCFFSRNLCQIWAYNESSHPLVPPKTIVSCVNYFWTKQKKQTILAVNVCAKIGRKTATMKNKNGNDLSKLSFWKSAAKTIHWLFRHENVVCFSTYKHTSTESVRMYNVTFLKIWNVKTSVYVLTVGPKTSRYYRNKKEWMTRSHRSEKAFVFDINLNAHFLRDKWHEKSG